MKVFVYGTLKRGYGNHRLLEGKTLIGEGITEGKYQMVSGGFPIIMASDDGLPVKGEVYDITGDQECLTNLDRLEGEGVMYDRKDVPVTLLNGDRLLCCIYEGNPRYWERRFGNAAEEMQAFTTEQAELEWHR